MLSSKNHFFGKNRLAAPSTLLDLPKHNRWECKPCSYQFSVTAGTIMHDSHLPLRKWRIMNTKPLEFRELVA